MLKDDFILLPVQPGRFLGLLMLALALISRQGMAYVGRAERFDEFKEEDLEEFHDELVHEEKRDQIERSDQLQKTLKFRKKEMGAAEGEEKKVMDEEIQRLQKELLRLPKRDRFRMALEGEAKYDSNIIRERPTQDKGDTVFDAGGNVEFDLSGRKTDLRFEVRGAKQWNIHFSEKDFLDVEERLRFRRKFFKKMTNSFQSRLARHSEKTIEMDDKKIRWDSVQNKTLNYAFSRKLSLNAEFEQTKRLFTTEAFDQDSSWEVTAHPSGFWNFTPKSRMSFGYKFGANRIRSKKGDANAHEIHGGYFGKITKKSSMSLDMSHSRQVPRALDTPRGRTITVGLGFIHQITPKSQGTMQFIRQLQNTTSNVDQPATDAAPVGAGAQVTKLDTHFVNDSLSFSLNSRLTRKIQAVLTMNASHVRTKAEQVPPAEDLKTRQFTFPLSLGLTYLVNRWATLRLAYTFAFRTGNEKQDTYRSHLWHAALSLNF